MIRAIIKAVKIMSKICGKCGVEKSLDAFHYRPDTKKIRNICHPCRIAQINEWQERNREQTRTNQRKYITRPHGRAVCLFNSAKSRARRKNEEFKLSLDDVIKGLLIGRCEKTGIEFDISMNPRHEKRTSVNPFAPSIDKINPAGIYEPSNVQYVSCWYNIARSQYTEEFFIEMCKKVLENLK